MAEEKKAAPQKKAKGIGRTTIILMVLTSMAIAIISVYSVVVLVFGLLPGLIAMVVDYDPRQYLSRIVISFNAVGVAPYILQILNSSVADMTAYQLIISPKTWLVIYASAGVGWVIYWMFPQIAMMLMPMQNKNRIESLNKELDELAEEWGEDVRGVGR